MRIDSAIRYTIKQFINDYFANYGLFTHRTANHYFNDNQCYDEMWVDKYYLPFAVRFGSTKMCLFFDDINYVFKLPLYSNMEKHAERVIVKEAIVKFKNGVYSEFAKEDDFCRVEANNYAEAEARGLDRYFAAEYKVMTYHGMPVYAQERIDEIYYESERYNKSVNDELWGEIETTINNLGATDEMCELVDNGIFVQDLYKYSGADFEDLLNFITDFKITDLHDENVGYDEYGHPKLIDYSGFISH